MKKIAIANLKGGVGKTSTAVILADTLSALGGRRVLALDLDSQSNLSWALMSPSAFDDWPEAHSVKRWLDNLIDGKPSRLNATLTNVSLQPDKSFFSSLWRDHITPKVNLAVAQPSMRFSELSFEGPIHSEGAQRLSKHLNECLAELSEQFDYCVMDCSPALSALTRAGLQTADHIIIPTPLNNLCLNSTNTFFDLALDKMLNVKASVYVVATRVGRSSGNDEANEIRLALERGEKNGRWQRLDPEFKELVEYTRALNPPELGPHQTLRSRYKSKVADLKKLLRSMIEKGLVEHE